MSLTFKYVDNMQKMIFNVLHKDQALNHVNRIICVYIKENLSMISNIIVDISSQ